MGSRQRTDVFLVALRGTLWIARSGHGEFVRLPHQFLQSEVGDTQYGMKGGRYPDWVLEKSRPLSTKPDELAPLSVAVAVVSSVKLHFQPPTLEFEPFVR